MTHAQRKKRNAGCRLTIRRPLLQRLVNFTDGNVRFEASGYAGPRFAYSAALTDLFTVGSLLAPLIRWMRPKSKEPSK